MHSLKLGKDKFLSLNSPDIKTAIIYLIEEKINIKLTLSDIKFDNKRHMLIIKGNDFYCYDRNFHYPKYRDHVYAAFLFLKSLDNVIENHRGWLASLV